MPMNCGRYIAEDLSSGILLFLYRLWQPGTIASHLRQSTCSSLRLYDSLRDLFIYVLLPVLMMMVAVSKNKHECRTHKR